MDTTRRNRILHAPNIHTGGGLGLLTSLLRTFPKNLRWLQCDTRAAMKLDLAGRNVTYVAPSLPSRLAAEWRLRTHATPDDTVICLHSLPPLFKSRAKVVVFVHSRLLVSSDWATGFPLRTKLRLLAERVWLRYLHTHADAFVVQTPSMADALRRYLGTDRPIHTCLFVPDFPEAPAAATKLYDYVYPATGDAHKNHAVLLDAWQTLAQSGCNPSLALTVDAAHYPSIAHAIARAKQEGLNITNLGALPASEMAGLYQSSRALLFPSLTESLGLPLLEAQQSGIAIVAAERDYVRDIVVPQETFDPTSALSLARAVLRHQATPMPSHAIQDTQTFWEMC